MPSPREACSRVGWPAIASGDHTLILAPTGRDAALTVSLLGDDTVTDTYGLQKVIRRWVGGWVGRKIRRRPMIIPTVLPTPWTPKTSRESS